MAASEASTSALDQAEAGQDWKYEKKKKFKPLEAMRKFFRSSRKRTRDREEEDSNMKAKSTSELLTESGNSESSYKVTKQTRSISEDSIFNPDQKEGQKVGIGQFSKGAKSAENVNENFKSELSRKLQKRQSFHSDDDGLPKSPASSFNTADTLLGRYEGSTVKSAPRDSDQSLLSVGSSDNEEDLFQTNWKATVASVVTRQSNQPKTDTPMDVDLSAVQPTTALKSEAARHRISVAPKARRGHGKRTPMQRNANISSLPELTEELPKSTEASPQKKKENLVEKSGKLFKPKVVKTGAPAPEVTSSTIESGKTKDTSEIILPTKKEVIKSDVEESSDKDIPSVSFPGGVKKIQLRPTLSDPSSAVNKTSNSTSLAKASSLNRDRSDLTDASTEASKISVTDSVDTPTQLSKRDSVKPLHSLDVNKETKKAETVSASGKVSPKVINVEEAEQKITPISAMTVTPVVNASAGEEPSSKEEASSVVTLKTKPLSTEESSSTVTSKPLSKEGSSSAVTLTSSQTKARTESVKKQSVPIKTVDKTTSEMPVDSSTYKTVLTGLKPVPDKGTELSAAKMTSISNKFGGQSVTAQTESSPVKAESGPVNAESSPVKAESSPGKGPVGKSLVKPLSDPPVVTVPAKTVSLPSKPALKTLVSSPVIKYGDTKTAAQTASQFSRTGKVSQLINKREMNETTAPPGSVDTQNEKEMADKTDISLSDNKSVVNGYVKSTTETVHSSQTSSVSKSVATGKPSNKLSEIKESENASSISSNIVQTESSTHTGLLAQVDKSSNLSQSKNSSATAVKSDSGKVTDSKVISVNASESSEAHRLASPKEDYKNKRQGRSKTLPEQPMAKVPIPSSASTQRNDYDNVTFSRRKPFLSDSAPPDEESESKPSSDAPEEKSEIKSSSPSVSPVRQVTTSITPASKRPEPKRLSLKDGLFSNSSEPVWVAMARKKNSEEARKVDDQSEQPKTKTAESASVKGTGISGVTRDIQKQPETNKIQASKPNFQGVKNTEVKSSDSSSDDKPSVGKSFTIEKTPVVNKPPTKAFSPKFSRKTETNPGISPVKSVTVDKAPVKQIKAPVSSESPSPSEAKPVPAWRTNLGKKKEPARVLELKKIEIIEKTPSQKPEQQETQTVVLREKSQPEKCVDVSARSSKVLDMVKNFQKLQVS